MKKNIIVKFGSVDFKFKDNYCFNIYQYDKYIDKIIFILFLIGVNLDDGVKMGINLFMMIKGFKNDFFQIKYNFGGSYYYVIEGFEIYYEGEFFILFDIWNIIVGGRFIFENFI